MSTIKFTKEFNVTNETIAYWAVTAFEGGISYWCDTAEVMQFSSSGWHLATPSQHVAWRTESGCGPYANPEFWASENRGYRLTTDDGDFVTVILSRNRILLALQKMADSDIKHERNTAERLLTEEYDADDADYLIQMSVFDEVVYGFGAVLSEK